MSKDARLGGLRVDFGGRGGRGKVGDTTNWHLLRIGRGGSFDDEVLMSYFRPLLNTPEQLVERELFFRKLCLLQVFKREAISLIRFICPLFCPICQLAH